MKKREMNFELMRIISMFFIVFWHLTCFHNINDLRSLINHTEGATYILLNIISFTAIVHVNSFVLITGYFNYQKEFSWKKFKKVFFVSWLYRILFALTFIIIGKESFFSLNFLQQIFPLDISDNYWYINCYLVLYLLTPFLNQYINSTSQKNHRNCILSCFIIFNIIASITKQMTVSNSGFNIINFTILYLIGSYLKKYPIEENYHFRNYSRRKLRNIFLIIFICCVAINILLNQYATYLLAFNNDKIKFIGEVIKSFIGNYSSPIIIIQSVAYFIIFKTITIKSKFLNKIIQIISPLVLGVYLIHFNTYIREHFYKLYGFDEISGIYDKSILLKLAFFVISIFIISIIIEKIRMLITQLLKYIIKKLTVK